MTAKAGLKARLGFGALMMMTGMAMPVAANAAEIIVYADAYYSGASRHYSGSVQNLDRVGFNDRISSIRVVSGFWTICTDADYRGRCERVSGDVSNLESSGLNDRISSLRLEGGGYDDGRYGDDRYYRSGIILYEDTNFRGRQVPIDQDSDGLGSFNFNDIASSVRVEGGRWEVCVDSNYHGRCEIIDGDVPYLGTLNMNDNISSVRRISGGGWGGVDGWWDRDRDDRWDRWDDDNEYRASVYEHVNYRGDRREFNGAVPDMTRYGFNDRISSFRLEGRWQVCEHVNFAGQCEIFRYDEESLVPSGWNDRISSMRPIGNADEDRRLGTLVLFEDVNFRGDRERVFHNVADLRSRGFNNLASSLRVRSGRWEVCSDVNFRGHCEVFDADESNLGTVRMNDRISSVRRVDAGYPGGPGGPGQWDDSITIFEHTNYGGRSRSFSRDESNLTTEGFNDLLSSFRIEHGVWELCEDANYQGRCWQFDNDVANVVPLGMNDRISSLRRIGAGGGGGGYPPYGHSLEVYVDVNYGGRSRTYTGTVSNLVPDGWNDTISSFRVNGPGSWEICEHTGFGGRCQVFSSDEPTLVPLNWNDRISSIRYRP